MFGSRILAYILGVAVAYLLYANGRMAILNLSYQHRIRTLDKQIHIAEQQEQELLKKIEEAKTEEYIEKVARQVLGLVKQDEVAYQINNK